MAVVSRYEKGFLEASAASVIPIDSLRTLRSLRLKISSADFVRDPEAFSTAAQIVSGALDKAASSRRSPRRKRSSLRYACVIANCSLQIANLFLQLVEDDLSRLSQFDVVVHGDFSQERVSVVFVRLVHSHDSLFRF